ncbi:MAG TPA: hypothetical protein GX524_00425 [Firmicutes bacterium]|jgi:peptide/nickel transport system substrate-binding protein|nr:hypothetical protein [Bacillota bacterium]
MRYKNSFRYLAVFLLAALFSGALFAGCTPAKPKEPENVEPEITKGGTFLQWVYWEQPMSNPVLSSGQFAHSYIFDPLVQVDENGDIQPRLAEKWDISPDGKEYTFTLRENVKWHDEEPFTADDVKFTFDAIMDPKTVTTQRSCFTVGDEVAKCEVVDPLTVKFILPQPFAPFLGKLGNQYSAVRIVPKHVFEGTDINDNPANFDPIGTGPFKMQERKTGEYAVLVRNDDYFLPVYLDKIVLKIIPNAEANVAAFENRELHATYLYDADVEKFADYPGVIQYRYSDGALAFLWLNVKKPLFSDKRVRQAIAYAIDKEDIANTVTYGLCKAAYNIYASSGPHAWVYNENAPRYEYNPEKAKEILADLGWKPGPDGVLVKDGQRFSFVHYGQTGFAQYEKVNTMLQAQLDKVGIEMEIRLLEPAAFNQKLREQVDPKDMDSHLTGAGPDVFDPDYISRFHSKSYPAGHNVYGYSNPEADKLLVEGVTTTDREARKEIYCELQNVIMEDIPYIPLYEFIDVNAVWDDLGGVPEDTTKDSSVITWYFTEKLYIKEPSGK